MAYKIIKKPFLNKINYKKNNILFIYRIYLVFKSYIFYSFIFKIQNNTLPHKHDILLLIRNLS